MDNFIVQLMARLDSSKTPDDLRKIEQELNKKKINLLPQNVAKVFIVFARFKRIIYTIFLIRI